MKGLVGLISWGLIVCAATLASAAPPGLVPAERKREFTVNGRRVVCYEHDSLPEWGYANRQRDELFIIHPAKAPATPAPLRVVLHSAGGSGESELLDAFKKPHLLQAHVEDDAYGLCLDCRRNAGSDWWWGQHGVQRNPEAYKTELYPTEKRVLASVAWATKNLDVDPERVYLSGISMGGSGSLGIGMCHGDVFAAISVIAPAGCQHAMFRLDNGRFPDPPPVICFVSQDDSWSKDFGAFLDDCRRRRLSMMSTWSAVGHQPDPRRYRAAVHDFPWLSIRRNEAYPVFLNVSTDQRYPGFQNLKEPDQLGQTCGLFRWEQSKDAADGFAMRLRIVKPEELSAADPIPAAATADVTFRRLQRFSVQAGKTYAWRWTRDGALVDAGESAVDKDGSLTIPGVKLSTEPGVLEILPPGTESAFD